MSEFIVYSIPGSPFGRAALMVLEEKGAAYRFSPVAPGTLKSSAHLARHPFGRIPVLQHDDFVLYETQAILRYVDRVVPGSPLTPSSPRAMARMDQLMNVNDWYLFHGVANVIAFQRIVGPRLLGLATDEAACAAVMPGARAVFDALSRQLGDGPFFVNGGLTLADVTLATQLDFLRATPEWQPLTAGHANLVAWMDRMNARPSMVATTWERVSEMARAA